MLTGPIKQEGVIPFSLLPSHFLSLTHRKKLRKASWQRQNVALQGLNFSITEQNLESRVWNQGTLAK